MLCVVQSVGRRSNVCVCVCSLVDEPSGNSKIFMEDGNFKPRVGKYSRTAGVQIASCRTRVRLQVLELNSIQYPGKQLPREGSSLGVTGDSEWSRTARVTAVPATEWAGVRPEIQGLGEETTSNSKNPAR